MPVKGWKYYNHAMIPTCAPHEEPDTTSVYNGEIWKNVHGDGFPLLARWTTEFDCKEETNWWYMVRFAPFLVEELPRSSRKHIRQALKKCYVERISASVKLEDMYRVYHASFEKYKTPDNEVSYEKFCRGCISSEQKGCEYWGGFDRNTGVLIGYAVICPYDSYVSLSTAKFSPDSLTLGVSAALYYTILHHYLNILNKAYISSGSRSINHKTNTEEYKIRHFGYRRVYCKLHIVYRPVMHFAVKVLYPIRRILMKLDGNMRMHQVNAILKMEEIFRNEER